MTDSSRPPEALLARAAAMRAAGESWQKVARAVGRSAERVRHWPREYPEEWNRAYRETETHFLADAAVESRQALRLLLRSKQEWVQLAAAQQMLKGRLVERVLALKSEHVAAKAAEAPRGVAPDDRALAAFINQVRSVSDEELDKLAREFLAEDSAAHPELYKPPRDAIAAPRDSG